MAAARKTALLRVNNQDSIVTFAELTSTSDVSSLYNKESGLAGLWTAVVESWKNINDRRKRAPFIATEIVDGSFSAHFSIVIKATSLDREILQWLEQKVEEARAFGINAEEISSPLRYKIRFSVCGTRSSASELLGDLRDFSRAFC